MNRISKSMIGGLCAFASICLLAPAVANVAPPGKAYGLQTHMGGVHIVAGSAFTAFDDGIVSFDFSRTYGVVKNWKGVRGHIFVYYHEESGGEVFETSYVIKADCLDVEEETGEAWIGGEVVDVTTNFGMPEVGWRIVNYVDDNDGGNPLNPDLHGSAWLIPESCEDRPEPFFLDMSQRGKIVVR